MTEAEFKTQIDRLRKVYGDRYYPDERAAMLWKKFGRHSAEIFEMALDEAITEHLSAMSASKINEAIRTVYAQMGEIPDPYKAQRDQLKEKARHSDRCWKCDNTGIVSAYRKYQNLQPTMVICSCYLGKLAADLPEYRGHRVYQPHDPFYMILDTDPHLSAKLDLYRGKYGTTDELMDWLSDLYWNHESKLGPLPWEYPLKLVT